jgi:hypothetical protein
MFGGRKPDLQAVSDLRKEAEQLARLI